MQEQMTVAAAQPQLSDGDLRGNVDTHVAAIEQAQARLVVFPELSLTGYALAAEALDLRGADIVPLVDACAATDSVALVGAPVEIGDDRYIAIMRIDSDGARVAYRKTHLGGEETDFFTPGPGPRAIEVDGWRVGLGICRDTGIAEHVQGTAALRVDLYACGVVHHASELVEQQRRGRTIAEACQAPVVMASFAGPTGGGFADTAGRSAVWSAHGVVLADADDLPGGIARTTLRRSRPDHPATATP